MRSSARVELAGLGIFSPALFYFIELLIEAEA